MYIIAKVLVGIAFLGAGSAMIVPAFQEAPAKSRQVLPEDSIPMIRARKGMRLMEEAYHAWKKEKNYTKAESLFLQNDALYGNPSEGVHLALAQMAEEQHNEKRAWREYKTVLAVASQTNNVTMRTSSILLRYGNLSEKYGTTAEARDAYLELIHTTDLGMLSSGVAAQSKNLLIQRSENASLSKVRQLAELSYATHRSPEAMKAIAAKYPNMTEGKLFNDFVDKGWSDQVQLSKVQNALHRL